MIYDIVMNLILLVVYTTLGFILVYKRLRSKDMDYVLVKNMNGYIFDFVLGIYAGKIRLTRQPGCVVPRFVKHVDGWEIVFPTFYSDHQINRFIMENDPPCCKKASHAKDLEVYREVVINRNENLECVAGEICRLPK